MSEPEHELGLPRVSGLSATATMLGIVGLITTVFGIGVFIGLAAVGFGILALRQMEKQPRRYGGQGFAITGIATGVCTVSLFVVMVVMTPSLASHELPGRTRCAANITGTLKSCMVYAQDNGDDFPRTPNTGPGYNVYFGKASTGASTDTAALAAMQTDANAAGNPASCLWILVVQGSVSPKTMICAEDPRASGSPSPVRDAATGNYYVAPGASNQFSYSIATPWVTDPATGATVSSGIWRNHTNAEIPMMCDMAPMQGTGNPKSSFAGASTDPKTMNSDNHKKGEGQEVGFGDCHVEWCRTPAVGPGGDNIFTVGPAAGGPWGGMQPTGRMPIKPGEPMKDIYMIPVRNLDDNTVH